MRTVVQRVKECHVSVADEIIAQIGHGLLVLLGVAKGDTHKEAKYLADKISHLRIFEDDQGKMNRSLLETGGSMLVVSQFTLLGDCRKGRRPSFIQAARPEDADRLYKSFVGLVKDMGIRVKTGHFRTMMAVSLINDGPVTIIIESPNPGIS
jgi:D-tyrosyl-tRNA(Tyr) deacylase